MNTPQKLSKESARAKNDVLLKTLLQLHDRIEDLKKQTDANPRLRDGVRRVETFAKSVVTDALRKAVIDEGVTVPPEADADALAKALMKSRMGSLGKRLI